jgi:hypothetical protein
MVLHQPGQSGSVRVKMMFLDSTGLHGIAVEEPLDIGAHSLVDQLEQACRRRVKAIVEVEYPVADVRETVIHYSAGP